MLYQRIQYFLKAAEAPSFSSAAEQMYLSPQALTKQITALEKELGGRLFDRSSQGVSLTNFGKYAYPRLLKIQTELNDTLDELKLWNHEGKAQLHIGIFSALPQDALITPLVTFLLGTFPQYQIILNMVTMDEGHRLLRKGRLDILITNIHEEEDLSSYRCLSLARHEAKVVVSLFHPWAIKDSLTLEDLKKETFLKLRRNDPHYTVPVTQSFYERVPCKAVQWVSNFDTMYTLLQQGNSFAVIPRAFQNMDHSRLKYFDFPGQTIFYDTAVIYNPSSPVHELEAVIEELKEEFDLTEL